MKHLALIMIALMTLLSFATAQNFVSINKGQDWDVWGVENWSAFSADSSATVTTGTLSITEYDSIDVYAKGSSAAGTAKFSGVVQGAFNARTGDFITLGTIDTTNIKTEVLKYISRIATLGLLNGRVSLTGSIIATPNRTDDKVWIYLVCHRTTRQIAPKK